jgi:Uma2 family endonuclease
MVRLASPGLRDAEVIPLCSAPDAHLCLTPSRGYAMGMPAQDAIWTADMIRALPDDGLRHEVLDGVHVVSPSPSRAHQRAVRVLLSLLEPYCARHGLGEALNSPADIEFSDRDLLQPDVFVVPNTGPSWREATTLLLAVEVLLPSTAHTDRHDKRTIYLRHGCSGVLDRRPRRSALRALAARRRAARARIGCSRLAAPTRHRAPAHLPAGALRRRPGLSPR